MLEKSIFNITAITFALAIAGCEPTEVKIDEVNIENEVTTGSELEINEVENEDGGKKEDENESVHVSEENDIDDNSNTEDQSDELSDKDSLNSVNDKGHTEEDLIEVKLTPFDISEIKPITPRKDGLDLLFEWENTNSEHIGVNYRICVEDQSKMDNCHEIASVIDSSTAHVRLDRIYPHTTTKFFVTAAIGENTISTNLFEYSYELFLSQAKILGSETTNIEQYTQPLQRIYPYGNVRYSTKTLSSVSTKYNGQPYELATEVTVTKHQHNEGVSTTKPLPNIDLDLLKNLMPDKANLIEGILSVERAVSDEIIKVTWARQGSTNLRERFAFLYYNGANYEWITDEIYGELDGTKSAFTRHSTSGSLIQVKVNGSDLTEVRRFNSDYTPIELRIFSGVNRDKLNASYIITTKKGENFAIWRSVNNTTKTQSYSIVKLEEHGSYIVDVLQYENGTPVEIMFDEESERLLVAHTRVRYDIKLGFDFELYNYKVNNVGLSLIDSIVMEEYFSNGYHTVPLLSTDGKFFIWNTYTTGFWSGYKISDHAMSMTYMLKDNGEFEESPEITMSLPSALTSGKLTNYTSSFMSNDMQAYIFGYGSKMYIIGNPESLKI